MSAWRDVCLIRLLNVSQNLVVVFFFDPRFNLFLIGLRFKFLWLMAMSLILIWMITSFPVCQKHKNLWKAALNQETSFGQRLYFARQAAAIAVTAVINLPASGGRKEFVYDGVIAGLLVSAHCAQGQHPWQGWVPCWWGGGGGSLAGVLPTVNPPIAVTAVINLPASEGRKEFVYVYQINPPSTHIWYSSNWVGVGGWGQLKISLAHKPR